MSFFRNHNAGKLNQLKKERDRIEKSNLTTDELNKKLKKLDYKIGYREGKEQDYKDRATRTKVVNKTKIDKSQHQTSISKADNSTKNYGANGNEITVVTETAKVNQEPKKLPPKKQK